MPTITLQNTINWAQPFLSYAPVSIGTGNEPAITSANTILQTILAPPFKWRWNRKTTTITTIVGTQDYLKAINDFGYLEQATAAIAGSPTFPLEIKGILGEATEQSRPTFISTQIDDNAGNITFRLLPVPETIYTVTITYQVRAPLFTALSGLWSPVPDYMEFIYNWGFLSLMQEYMTLTGAQRTRQLFVAALLSTAEGLEESEKNLFISSWLGQIRQSESNELSTQTGQRARSI
jgi:hypothetical protein